MPRRSLGLIAVALLGFASPQPPDAAAQSAPRATVQETIDAVLVILNDKALSTEQKRSRIETIAYQRFDFPSMSRLVLARNWQRFSKPQQTRFIEEFKRYLAVNYGNRIERYDQQKVDIVGERQEPRGDVTIQSVVRGGEFEGATVDYRLRQNEGRWLVIDVIVEGISLISNFRDQFKEVLARGGPEELLEALRAKNAAGPVHRIQGREVRMPVLVRRASSGSATFLVGSAAARALIHGEGLDVAEVLPGRALCSIAIIDYADNDLGDYHEVSIALFVRPGRGSGPRYWLRNAIDMARGRLGTYIVHLPVDQEFTCEAGRSIWGFPKTVQKIDFEYRPERVTCKLFHDGAFALSLSLPRGGARSLPEADLATYTFIEGVLHRTAFRSGADGFGVRMGAAELTLGSGKIAAELRSLGLPRRSLLTTWMERMHARFGSAEKV